MGKGYRTGRLGEEIRKIVSEMLISGIKDPRLTGNMVSLSGVDVTNDGSYATCYVSVLNFSKDPEAKAAQEAEVLAQAISPTSHWKGEVEVPLSQPGKSADLTPFAALRPVTTTHFSRPMWLSKSAISSFLPQLLHVN